MKIAFFRKELTVFRTLVIGQVIIALVIISLFILASLTPQKFLKLATLRADPDILQHIAFDTANFVNPQTVISKIPYQKGRFVDVLPERRYQRSIVGGRGDCSNLSQGFAYWLLKSDIDFAVVHLLRIPGFTNGEGHVALETVLRLNEKNHSGILDLLEGGVLTDGNSIVSAQNIIDREHADISVISYHHTRDNRSAYYEADNLAHTVVGFTPDEEVAGYFNFISSFYIDLGNRSVERYLYDGLALLTGNFPTIRVGERGFERIKAHYTGASVAAAIVLWLARLGAVMFIVLIVVVLKSRFRFPRKINNP